MLLKLPLRLVLPYKLQSWPPFIDEGVNVEIMGAIGKGTMIHKMEDSKGRVWPRVRPYMGYGLNYG